MWVGIGWGLLSGCASVAKEPGSSGDGAAAASGAAASAGNGSASGGSANGASAGSSAQAGVGADAGSSAISCDWNLFDTGSVNEVGIGAGCTGASTAAETAACGSNFCTRRVLADRWPVWTADQSYLGYCTKHCQSDSECGSGFSCCEARSGPFCLRFQETAKHGSGCSERCASDHLGCGEGEICCERTGKICTSDHCSGTCLE